MIALKFSELNGMPVSYGILSSQKLSGAYKLLSAKWDFKITWGRQMTKKEKMALKASGSSSLPPLSQALPLVPSSSFSSLPLPIPPLCPQISILIRSPNLPFPWNPPYLTRLPLYLSEPFPLKLSFLRIQSLSPYLWATVRDFPEVTEYPYRFTEEFYIY